LNQALSIASQSSGTGTVGKLSLSAVAVTVPIEAFDTVLAQDEVLGQLLVGAKIVFDKPGTSVPAETLSREPAAVTDLMTESSGTNSSMPFDSLALHLGAEQMEILSLG
jgi:hypothetical protein